MTGFRLLISNRSRSISNLDLRLRNPKIFLDQLTAPDDWSRGVLRANTAFPKFITANRIDRMLAQALTVFLIWYGAASYEGCRFSPAISWPAVHFRFRLTAAQSISRIHLLRDQLMVLLNWCTSWVSFRMSVVPVLCSEGRWSFQNHLHKTHNRPYPAS